MKRGFYETEYGNVAFVGGPNAKTAWDIDMGEEIPIEAVLADKFIRSGNSKDD